MYREETVALAKGNARRNETQIIVSFSFMKLSFLIGFDFACGSHAYIDALLVTLSSYSNINESHIIEASSVCFNMVFW